MQKFLKTKTVYIVVILAILAIAAAGFYFLPFEADIIGDKSVSDKSSDSQVYVSVKYKFSFNYPKEFQVSLFADGGGDAILVKNAASDSGFQIFIIAFDEPKPITKERILKDIPDMAISGDEYINIGGEQALSFISQDDLGGKTREIWLARGDYLYQIKAYENFEKQMLKIIKTWKFQ